MTSGTLIRKNALKRDGEKYEYSLFAEESRQTASYGLRLYSISINLTRKDGSTEVSCICDAFSDRAKAISFFEALVENEAEPFDLSYLFDLSMATT